MLSISNIKSSGAAGSYYAEDNYYSQDENKAQSQWMGQGAAELGLSGVVEPTAFKEVLDGNVGGVQLGRIMGRDAAGELMREHRPGMDITLSAPKSVSLLAEVGGRGDVRDAHEAAVGKVLDYIEKNLAGARVTEEGTTRFEKTGNVLAARFQHTTSRDLDPQTHTHLVLANATMTSDGQWRSLSNEAIYKSQTLLGKIYDTELAANLRAQGYRLEAGEEGRWEVAGFTKEQLEHFSQRSKAIEERLQGFGLTRETATAAQRESAALLTRASKGDVDHPALRAEWRQRAQEVRIDFEKLELNKERGGVPSQPTMVAGADVAVSFAVLHLTEREAAVDRGAVIEMALVHSQRVAPWVGVTLDSVEKAIDRAIEKKTILLGEGASLTTPEATVREQDMLERLEKGRGTAGQVADKRLVESRLAAFEASKSIGETVFKLTDGQRDSATLVLTSPDRFVAIQGYAGSGKTTMMEVVGLVAKESGYTVRGMAASGEAAHQLEKDSGIPSTTTARFLIDQTGREQARDAGVPMVLTGAIDLAGRDVRSLVVSVPAAKEAPGKELWVLDEASLAGQKDVSRVMEMADKASAKVVFVGDRLQLNAVDAGKPFELLQGADIAGSKMSEISRQRVDDLREAVALAIERRNAQAMAAIDGRVVELPSREALLSRAVSDILSKTKEERARSLLLVPLNKDRELVNNQVREGLVNAGQISNEKGAELGVLVAAGLTEAQRASVGYYASGMVVRFGSGYRRLGVQSGDYAKVVSVDIKAGQIALEKEGGGRVIWAPHKQSKVEVYGRETRALAAGDEIRFSRNSNELEVKNGTRAKVLEVTEQGFKAETANGVVSVSTAKSAHAHWEYAYSTTVHSSQGKTADATHLLITSDSGRAIGERAFYVGVTRGRDDMTIYTDSKAKARELISVRTEKAGALESLGGMPGAGEVANAVIKTSGGSSGGRGVEMER